MAQPKSQLERQEDGSLKLTITLPWASVKKTRDEVVKEAAATMTLPGFRKGKAPEKLIEENLNQDKIREEVLRKLLPAAYVEAVKEHNLNPIMNPKIHIELLEEGKDWQFHALTCESPKVTLGDYKKHVQKVTAKSKIIVPGQDTSAGLRSNSDPERSRTGSAQGKKEPSFDELVKILLEHVTVAIPSIMTEQEVDRLLSQTLNEVKTLGLTLDQYLASTNRTPDALRAEYEQKAANDIKLEFILQEIAQTEKITVEQKEVDEAIQKAKDPAERQNMEANKYLLANIIRQQKTIDFVKNL